MQWIPVVTQLARAAVGISGCTTAKGRAAQLMRNCSKRAAQLAGDTRGKMTHTTNCRRKERERGRRKETGMREAIQNEMSTLRWSQIRGKEEGKRGGNEGGDAERDVNA